MRRFIVTFAVASAAMAASVSAKDIEPKQIKDAAAIGRGNGVVILSVRSQDQLFGKLSIWFEAADEIARRSADQIKFERKQGIPLAGYNMVDLKPSAFRVPAGKWRLLAHTVHCGELPPPNAVCSVTGVGGGIYPTARYDGSSLVLDVRPGAVTNGGDVILEFPEGTDLRKGPNLKRQLAMRLKWKPLPEPVAAAIVRRFPGLEAHQVEGVAPSDLSIVRCADAKAKTNGGMTIPFDC